MTQKLYDQLNNLTSASPVPPALLAVTSGSSAAPVPMSSATTATVVGVIRNSITGANIGGASITSVPIGSNCKNQACPGTQTDSAGKFSVQAWPGSDQILASASYYLNNYTILTNVTAGQSYNIGTMYLVPNGNVVGILEANDTAHSPLSGIKVQGQSRDGKIISVPYTFSASNGRFNVTVPPGQSVAEIAQTGCVLGDNLFVDPSPGQTINVGVVYLTVGVLITLEPFDASTNRPISTGLAGAGPAIWSLEADNPITGQGFTQGTAAGIGGAATTCAPPGEDLIHIRAAGYITNTTYFNVQGTFGKVLDLGKVFLEPGTLVSFQAGLTWASKVAAAEGKYGVGDYYGRDCSLDGYSFSIPVMNQYGQYNMTSNTCITSQVNTGGCIGPGSGTTFILGAPLRNVITDYPDTSAACFPPTPTWPIPNFLPVQGNWTWVNLTAGKSVNIGSLDFTPGNYIEVKFSPAGVKPTIAACSTDVTGLCFNGGQEGDLQNFPPPNGCLTNSNEVCVPAPPGPVELKATAVNCLNNLTWAYVPPGSWTYAPIPLSVASENHFSTINLVCDQVQGTVRDAITGGIPSGLVSVVVESAGSAAFPQAECAATGQYTCGAPPGWDVIVVSAPNYEVNKTWIYIGAPFTVAPMINLTPLSFITGQVVGPSGLPLNTTSAAVCPITAASGTSCQSVQGAGLPNTAGVYWAQVPAGHVPIGQYMVVVNAPGYLSNQTWVNVSEPGTMVTADQLVLRPLLGSSRPVGPGSPLGPSSTPSLGEFVVGRILDNVTSAGVPAATITQTPTLGGAPNICTGLCVSTDGWFNFTSPLGEYWFNVSAPGYYPYSTYQDLNGSAPAYSMGVIRLDPLNHLTGRVVIDPWRNVVSIVGRLGAQATVQVCNHAATLCGVAGLTDSGGFFNLTAPLGLNDRVRVAGTGTGAGSVANGYMTNNSFSNVTANDTEGTIIIGLIIYAAYAGYIRDGSTDNVSPVRFASDALIVSGTNPQSLGEQANGGGFFVGYIEPGNISRALFYALAFESNTSTMSWNYTVQQMQNYTDAQTNWFPNESLTHFGWVQVNVLSVPSAYGASVPEVPFAAVSLNVTSAQNIQFTSLSTSDGFGFANVTAPPGKNVTISVSAPDYDSTQLFNIQVDESATTFVNGTGNANEGTVTIVPWGWVNGTVYDPAAPPTGLGIDAATVTVQNDLGQSGAGSVSTNEIGQFMIDTPLGNPVSVGVVASGYATNNSQVNVYTGSLTHVPTVNMTGEGIVAGQIFGFPGHRPLYGVSVRICPVVHPACLNSNATTNGSGYFWVTASAGLDVMNLSLSGYSLNGTPLVMNIISDHWYWSSSELILSQYASVTGIVLGNPSGVPLFNASVSACSPLALAGEPTGPCFDTVATDVTGRFFLSIPAGQYVLNLTTPGYNATYLPIDLFPGEHVNVGTIFLEQFGTIAGTVLGADTHAPIRGAEVEACPFWTAGNCTATAYVGSNGQFSISGAPGQYLISAAAPGYENGYEDATIIGGIQSYALPIYLVPASTNTVYQLTGTVVAGPTLAPLAGAVVAAGSDFATATNSAGAFDLQVPWGTYYLTAAANGYSTQGQLVQVYSNQSGIDFVLPQAVYQVSGTTTDGLTGQLIGNVNIMLGTQQVAASDSNGNFAFTLGNGSYRLDAQPSGGEASILAPVGFTIAIDGAGVVRNVQLFPPSTEAIGLVVNVLTGAPLENVTISVAGTTIDNIPWSATLLTSATGGFVVPLYAGHYTITATKTGYDGAQTSVAPTANSSLPVNFGLTPISVVASQSSNSGSGLTPALLLGALAVVGIAAYLTVGRMRTEGTEFGPALAAASGGRGRGGSP